MKSKLTLRLDDDLDARAEDIARERGTSVSKLVQNYVQLLQSRKATPQDDDETVELTPRLKTVHEQIGAPPDDAPFEEPRGELSPDERRFVEAASDGRA